MRPGADLKPAVERESSDHHERLERDLQAILDKMHARRRTLRWLACAGVAFVASCNGDDSSGASGTDTAAKATGTTSSTCVADPEETNGPFPADGSNSVDGSVVNVLTRSGIVRRDITSSFGSSTATAPGVPLTLTITLENTGSACGQLPGYAIYVWHCNRDGEYSLYSSGITNENYLRGVQVTDSNGRVTFNTIFPACYSGRYPHIHVEVYASLAQATGQTNALLTTQLALPRSVCETVYANATGYSASVGNLARVTTSTDNVFDTSTATQLSAQTPAMSGNVSDGYTAVVSVGLAL